MSNPTPPSSNKPNPYFTGIIYNPTDYISIASSSALTYGQATTLFIQKTIADIVTGVTNFTNGLTASSIFAKSTSAICNLWTTSQSGVINIGTYAGRSAIIHIGDGDNNVAGSAIHLNNGINTPSNVNILNGTGSTGTINLGSSTSTTNCNCPLTITYAPSALTANTQLGRTVSRSNTAQPFTNPSTTVVDTYQITTAGVYLLTWSVQVQNPSAVSMFYTNICAGANATAVSPTVNAVANWGNSPLGLVGSLNYQSSNGSTVVNVSSSAYYNVVLYVNGGGMTACGVLYTITRIG